MTQKIKDLLLKYLCMALPYDVIVNVEGYDTEKLIGIENETITTKATPTSYSDKGEYPIDIVKPYLRPMSSMTEEQKEELKSKCIHTETEEDWEGVRCDVWGVQILDKYDTGRWDNPIWPSTINMDAIDWLNAHHFDYRGLIEKGLAIEVAKDNNPYKE